VKLKIGYQALIQGAMNEIETLSLQKAEEILKVAYGGNVLRGLNNLAALNGDA